MSLIIKTLIFFLITTVIVAREKGETEITTEDGIEVYQNEKYYLLKKNVKIVSDNFMLNAEDDVRINFSENLYDITKLQAKGNVEFISPTLKIEGSGENLDFEVKIEKLKNESILIKAKSIDGIFSSSDNENKKEITLLNIVDEKISYVKNGNTEMYAKKINFNNTSSIIELIDNVTIIRDGEKISGDYGTLDTINNSYKIKSNDQKKVKVIIQNDE